MSSLFSGAELTRQCQEACEQSDLVQIDANAAAQFALALDIHEVKQAPTQASDDPERTAALLLAWNAINYSYYPDEGNARWAWQAPDGSIVGADDEANGVVAALAHANSVNTAAGVPSLADPEFLRAIDAAAIDRIFKPAPQAGALPLSEERAAALREVGAGLGRLGMTPLGLVRAASGSAAQLVATLVREFPSYADVQVLDGTSFAFNKRAQLCVSMMHGAGVGGGFSDVATALTVFADYRVPQLLRVADVGVLTLAPTLAAQIDEGKPITRGSAEEVMVRAATIWATSIIGDALRAQAGAADVSQAQLDYYLWRTAVRRDAAGELPAFHKTRCTAY